MITTMIHLLTLFFRNLTITLCNQCLGLFCSDIRYCSYKAADSFLVIGSCFACPVGSADSNSKPDVDSPGFGNSWQLQMFLICKSFRFSPRISPDESHHSSDPQHLPTQRDPSGKKTHTIISIAGVSLFDNSPHSQEEILTTNKITCHDILKWMWRQHIII